MHLCFMLWYDLATIHLLKTTIMSDVVKTLVMLPLPVRLLATLRAVSHNLEYVNRISKLVENIIIIIYSYLSKDIPTDLSVFLQGALSKYLIECVEHEVMWHCEYQEEQSST